MPMQSADCHVPFTVFWVIINQTKQSVNKPTYQMYQSIDPSIDRSIERYRSVGRGIPLSCYSKNEGK